MADRLSAEFRNIHKLEEQVIRDLRNGARTEPVYVDEEEEQGFSQFSKFFQLIDGRIHVTRMRKAGGQWKETSSYFLDV